MITKKQINEMILQACPSFQETWDSFDDKEFPYAVTGELARHLLVLYRAGKTEEFAPLWQVIEDFHIYGSHYVKELATIGILEDIQSVWANNDTDPEEFFPFLLPESKKWWIQVNDFWAGKIPYVGYGIT